MITQLLADYYRSVVENERFYYEYMLSKGHTGGNVAADDQLQLQKQVNKLTVELQSLVHENERLREYQKTQRQVLEAKIQGLKKNVEHLKNNNEASSASSGSVTRSTRRNAPRGAVGKDTDLSKRSEFHLLSPMSNRVRTRAYKAGGLKEVLKTGKQTIFDDSHVMQFDSDSDDDENTLENSIVINNNDALRKKRGSKVEESMEFTSDNSNDIAFLENMKVRDKSLNLPSEELSPDEDTQSSNVEQSGNTKRRRLAKRRIQTMESDNSDRD